VYKGFRDAKPVRVLTGLSSLAGADTTPGQAGVSFFNLKLSDLADSWVVTWRHTQPSPIRGDLRSCSFFSWLSPWHDLLDSASAPWCEQEQAAMDETESDNTAKMPIAIF